MPALQALRARARRTCLVQAARVVELLARTRHSGRGGGVGEDLPLADEPLHFNASDRMAMPIGEIVEIQAHQARVTMVTTVMGLVGATPALPSYYSEVQLQRRRLRDPAMAAFYNIFDHRALSFFYRIARKHSWLLEHERAGAVEVDTISNMLLAYAGLSTPAMRDRLAFPDVSLAPVANLVGDRRRSAATLASVLAHVTGLDLRVKEAVATWIPLPRNQQTRLGASPRGQSARLGKPASNEADAEPDAALIGSSVLDLRHIVEIETGPLNLSTFMALIAGGEMMDRMRDACRLIAGIQQQFRLRLLIAQNEVVPLQLGAASACLSRTTWLGRRQDPNAILAECTMLIT